MSDDSGRSAAAARSADPFLIWEDEEPGSEHWWLARAREVTTAGRRDFLVAEDDLTQTLVCITLPPRAHRYAVIGVVWLRDAASRHDAMTVAKGSAVQWLASPHDPRMRQAVLRWQFYRATRIIWRNLPLTLAGFGLGAVLGLAVALFAVSSGLVGWPTLIAGVVIGAAAGPALKFLVDRKAATAPFVGPWARFFIVTLAAVTGAAVAAGGVLTLFWN